MKNVFVVLLVICTVKVYSQCNANMTGIFTQSDSCKGWSQFQSKDVNIIASTGNDIIIEEFDSFIPLYDATVTLDCSNLTATIPTQYPGMTTLWGSGTFSADFNTMTLNYSVDFGTSVSTCVGKFLRVGVIPGVADDKKEQERFSITPNPNKGKFQISNPESQIQSIEIYNVLGEIIQSPAPTHLHKQRSEGEMEIDLSSQPKGIYFVKVQNGDKVAMRKIIIQ